MCSKSPCRPCIRPRVPIETRRAVRGAPSPKVLSSPSRVVVSSCGVQYMIVEPGRRSSLQFIFRLWHGSQHATRDDATRDVRLRLSHALGPSLSSLLSLKTHTPLAGTHLSLPAAPTGYAHGDDLPRLASCCSTADTMCCSPSATRTPLTPRMPYAHTLSVCLSLFTSPRALPALSLSLIYYCASS